jgi:gluconate 2-dehydrogenase gamma chain
MKMAALGAGGLTLAAGCGPQKEPDLAGQAVHEQREFLGDDEAVVLGAIADQIVPPDEWPGGKEAGVVTYIDRQLAGPYRRFQGDYRKGLAAVTGVCMARHGQRFEALTVVQQQAVLADMEAGRLQGDEWKEGFGPRFFELLRSHSLQGYYGSPRHGGNRDGISFKMMGLDEFQIIGQNRYRS